MLVTAGLPPDYGLPQETDFSQLPEVTFANGTSIPISPIFQFSAMGSTSNRDYSMSSGGEDNYTSRRISTAPPTVPRRYLPQQLELDETSVI